MTPQPLPTDFVLGRTFLTWREALWGYEHQWIDWSCLTELAVERISSESKSHPAAIELAGMMKEETAGAGDLVRVLANTEPVVSEEILRQKWLYLILRWLFENREQFSDPLAMVEDIFCDFGHPLEIAKFIRYMPVTDNYDPRQHSKAENEERMFNHWREYLKTAEKQFGFNTVKA
jgi:hypothetical protein